MFLTPTVWWQHKGNQESYKLHLLRRIRLLLVNTVSIWFETTLLQRPIQVAYPLLAYVILESSSTHIVGCAVMLSLWLSETCSATWLGSDTVSEHVHRYSKIQQSLAELLMIIIPGRDLHGRGVIFHHLVFRVEWTELNEMCRPIIGAWNWVLDFNMFYISKPQCLKVDWGRKWKYFLTFCKH